MEISIRSSSGAFRRPFLGPLLAQRFSYFAFDNAHWRLAIPTEDYFVLARMLQALRHLFPQPLLLCCHLHNPQACKSVRDRVLRKISACTNQAHLRGSSGIHRLPWRQLKKLPAACAYCKSLSPVPYRLDICRKRDRIQQRRHTSIRLDSTLQRY